MNAGEIPYNNTDDDHKKGCIDEIYGWNFGANKNNVSNSGSGSWHGAPVVGIICDGW